MKLNFVKDDNADFDDKQQDNLNEQDFASPEEIIDPEKSKNGMIQKMRELGRESAEKVKGYIVMYRNRLNEVLSVSTGINRVKEFMARKENLEQENGLLEADLTLLEEQKGEIQEKISEREIEISAIKSGDMTIQTSENKKVSFAINLVVLCLLTIYMIVFYSFATYGGIFQSLGATLFEGGGNVSALFHSIFAPDTIHVLCRTKHILCLFVLQSFLRAVFSLTHLLKDDSGI